MSTILEGAIVLLLFIVGMACVMFCVICAVEDDRQRKFTDEDIQQMRFDYTHYEEDDIES